MASLHVVDCNRFVHSYVAVRKTDFGTEGAQGGEETVSRTEEATDGGGAANGGNIGGEVDGDEGADEARQDVECRDAGGREPQRARQVQPKRPQRHHRQHQLYHACAPVIIIRLSSLSSSFVSPIDGSIWSDAP